MKETISQWFAWLKKVCTEPVEVATSPEDERLAHVYSDGQQMWASDSYSLHALDIATEKSGRVIVSEKGVFQVGEAGDIPLPRCLAARGTGRIHRRQRGESETGCRRSGRLCAPQPVREQPGIRVIQWRPECVGDTGNRRGGMVVLAARKQ